MPLELKIPGFTKAGRFPHGKITLKHLVMDVNGTLARDGEFLPGMVELARASRRATLRIRFLGN